MKKHHPSIAFRLRILAVALIPLLLAVGLLAIYFTQRSGNEMQKILERQGHASAKHLAEASSLDLLSGNLTQIKRLLDYEISVNRFEAAAISDGSNWLLISGKPKILPKLTPNALPTSWQEGPILFFAHVIQPASSKEFELTLITQQTTSPNHYLVVSLSRSPIELSRSRAGLAAFGAALISTLFALLLAWRLSGHLSRPLHNIIKTVAHLAGGELSERTPETSRGEIGLLESGVNQMARALEENQHNLKLRVQEATSELLAQKLSAEAAVLAKSRFLAAASHDMRQPLHALTLLVAALREQVPDGEAARLAKHIESSAAAMESLLNGLLDLSKLDAGVIEARPQCFRVQNIFNRVAEQFIPVALAQGIQLRIIATSVCCYSDAVLVERIVSNLVSNALRYTEQGRVLVGVRRVGPDWLRFEVRDTGKGIPYEFQTLIFEEYFQLDNTERHRNKGLGLGLAIVTRLIRLLGSQIQVNSTPGRGAAFSFQLARCEATEVPTERTRQSISFALPLENALVAIIDDDEAILTAMVEIFDRWDVALAVGADAKQVCAELKELGRAPDLILCDYHLTQGLTGIEAIQLLRENFGADIPAALITGDTASGTLKSIQANGLPVLQKPLKPAKLRAFLSHLLSESSTSILSTHRSDS